MFFSEDLLTSKKGTFGIIWLAATLGPRSKKITKKELTSVDLAKTCHLIAEPPEPLALRLSGSLLVGVTRVYNQNYDVFYSDVTNFHQTLRRSIVTDFATTTGNIPAGHVNLDLPGGGKSKFDVITFPNAGIDLDFGLDLRFQHIDWQNPLSIGRKRRASSKLSSQATQEGSADESDEENEDSEVEEIGRDAKRKKYSSSPFIGATTISKARNSVHHPSEPTGALYAGIDMPIGEIDLGLDLEGMNDAMPDDSFSAPSGRGFELPAAGDEAMFDEQADLIPPSRQGSAGPVEHFSPPPELAVTSPNSGNRRSADALLSDEGSVGDVENQLDVPKPKKVRKVKKVTFDSNIELSSGQDAGARQQYRDMMDDQRQAVEIKSREKAVEARASALVDSTGGLEFLDPDMQSFFSTFTQVKSFKWETEATVNRLVSGPQEPELQDNGRQQNQYDLAGENGDMPTGMDGDQQDTFQSYDVPIHELSASARQGSLAPDMEYARRYSQGSQQGPLPWEERARSATPGFVELGDTSFSPASLRLSIMTPQEAKLRSRSHPNSSGPASLARRRNRSSSLMSDRPDDDPLLLVQGDDLELPDNEVELQLESLAASQQARLADLPQAFRPEMLATLETQCRDFFTFVEKKMVTLSIDELDFEDIAPVENTKHVAAVAFYDCLNLATKKILAVNQEEPWGPITVRFAVDSN